MKLNHKEFRIGNLVEYDGRVFEIDSVSEVLPTLNTIEFGIGVVDWNNLKPIPLNEDWLVKFGFENVDDEIDYSEFVLNYVTIEGNGSDKQEPFHFVRGVDYRERKTEIKYVHQLQNLYFALTGIELTLTDK